MARERGRRCASAGLFCLTCLCGATALGADFTFTPFLGVSEEFSDNVLDSAVDRRSDFITRVQPGAQVNYRSPAIEASGGYNFDYHHYLHGTKGDERNHNANLRGKGELVDNFFFVELADTLTRVSLDIARDSTAESLYSNQSDSNTGIVNPYLMWRLGEKTTLKTSYRFVDTRYWNGDGINKRENRWGADFTLTPTQRLSLSAGYAFAELTTDLIDYTLNDVNAGFSYEFAERSFVHASIGHSWQDFAGREDTRNLFWDAGVTKDFGPLSATLASYRKSTEAPLSVYTIETGHRLLLEKRLSRGAVGLSTGYTKYRETILARADRSKTAVGLFWHQELSDRLNGNLALSGDHMTGETYSYHFTGSGGVNYQFNHGITAGLTYTFVAYQDDIVSGAGGKHTNRVIVALKKTF
ncbi:TIGR03016 family PEP-CTERM system-associated outer membrane protein [Geomonas subterranea]|uniref:TIGR03016 family PEP-CTERM system-associated outer membrane protein n=1 Tax=Geomonas subterranea TaxID=2847989 RepID=A0ABX8LJX6_9BACT|nr:TIGR03016 family PEP-CTERM system-associated outer membrane protein [Geomonas subterranea]QXE91661.1 TIGR03016 family PEP-CTERM system-associated outer membrane protein [Geomonas subterranea]QXM10245.1 TIGR03016 family PEP-CTERM system-associated outer membrane protein [Geomonas subterranea]